MPFEIAICCCSGRGKASVLWLMAFCVYFKWWRVPLLSSYGDFRSMLSAAVLVYRTLSFYYSILFLSREWLKLVSHTNLYSFTSTSVSRFFKELEKKHEQNIVIDDITDIVCKHSQSSFDPYITYCSNEVYQQRTLQRLVWVTEQAITHTYALILSFVDLIQHGCSTFASTKFTFFTQRCICLLIPIQLQESNI